ncbi:MAG: SdiA-regulated domain-containing protein [Cellvibrionaceae bacterium]
MSATLLLKRLDRRKGLIYLAKRYVRIWREFKENSHAVVLALVALPTMALLVNFTIANLGGVINLWWQAFEGTDKPSIALGDYHLMGEPVILSGISHNASGLTFNHDTHSLFAITNNPTNIVEMTTSGVQLRVIPLLGFDDTEGITYLGDDRFALVEEEHRGVVLVNIHETTDYLLRSSGESLAFSVTSTKNKGFEGIAFDAVEQSLFVVNEKKPRAIYRLEGVVSDHINGVSIQSPWSMEDNSLFKRDLSGLHFLSDLGTLLVLSDDSKSLTETSREGERISTLSLRQGSAGLAAAIPQPEGVTVDDKGHLYVLSEPNLFYRFAPRFPSSASPDLAVN